MTNPIVFFYAMLMYGRVTIPAAIMGFALGAAATYAVMRCN